MHPFQAFISRYTELSPKEWQIIETRLRSKVVKKGTLLLEEGQICRRVYFLETGLLRYFVWKDGLAVSKFFTQPPYCFTSQRSFTQQIPARENIETLEDSLIWQLEKADSDQLLKLPAWSNFVRELVQEVQFFTEEILVDLQNETAENRYRMMVEQGDPLLQKVSLKHLASYLGIAPQSLSRIRKKFHQERK
ncbi:MAG: Crp/Fnr family transcriptional regulator [Saprospiraceae bacterium]